MIINNSNQFIFVHIPKTGGTSVTSLLSSFTNYCDLEIGGTNFGEKIAPIYSQRFGLRKHATAATIRAIVGSVCWSQYFSFCIVRNPFARCLSTYKFLKCWKGGGEKFQDSLNKMSTFDDFVLSDLWSETNGPDEIFRPQIAWLRENSNSDNIIVDYIAKLETLGQNLKEIAEITLPGKSCSDIAIPHLNKSRHKSGWRIDRPLVVDAIRRKYKKDFALLGYEEDSHVSDS